MGEVYNTRSAEHHSSHDDFDTLRLEHDVPGLLHDGGKPRRRPCSGLRCFEVAPLTAVAPHDAGRGGLDLANPPHSSYGLRVSQTCPWEMIMTVEVDDEGLDFFNALSGWLDIALSEPAQPISKGMQNLAASPSARVERVSLTMRVLEDKGLRNLTDEEWTRVVLRTPVIRMCGNDGKCVVEHGAPNGAAFTVRDLAAAIAETR